MRKEAGCYQAKLKNKITIGKSLAHAIREAITTFFGEPVSLNCQLWTVFSDKSRSLFDEFLYSHHLSARLYKQ